MIDYQITGWMKTTFSLKGTVLPRIFLRVSLFTGVTLLLLLFADQWVTTIQFSPLMHSLIGTALGLVLVFRNNGSYDRYWEGRKKWGGIVNSSRNLARAAQSYTPDWVPLASLICAFPHALKHQLRSENSKETLLNYASEEQVEVWLSHPNPALMINTDMSRWVANQVQQHHLTVEFAQRIETYIGFLMDHQGACERILKTPVPFAHAIHVRQLLFIYLLTLPLVLIPIFGWYSVLAITLIGMALLGIEEAGVEIEDPFGHDYNDLPLNSICDVIHRDVRALLCCHHPDDMEQIPRLEPKVIDSFVRD